MTQEHRAKIAAALRGRSLSPEHRAAIGAGQANRVQTPGTIARITASKWARRGIDVTSLSPAQLALLRRLVRKGATPQGALDVARREGVAG